MVLVTGLLLLGAPPDGSALEIDVVPPEFADGPDAVTRLVREHERDAEPPADLPGHVEQGLVLFVAVRARLWTWLPS